MGNKVMGTEVTGAKVTGNKVTGTELPPHLGTASVVMEQHRGLVVFGGICGLTLGSGALGWGYNSELRSPVFLPPAEQLDRCHRSHGDLLACTSLLGEPSVVAVWFCL